MIATTVNCLALNTQQRQNGCFYTEANPFRHKAFKSWAKKAGLPQATILEPFAGSARLIDHLRDLGLCGDFLAYDINPSNPRVKKRNTFLDFPTNANVCITNPPWLARNVATRFGMHFPACGFQDIYAYALDICLKNCAWTAALIPESFLRTGLFRERLCEFISLVEPMFIDTDHPVGLALFGPDKTDDVVVWSGTQEIGLLSELEKKRPQINPGSVKIRFNDVNGNVGLIALDNTRNASIRFCPPEELGDYQINHSRRSITKISVNCRVDLDLWNNLLNQFRKDTFDVLMTPYRGLRKDGKYRRRCDWNLARGLIQSCG